MGWTQTVDKREVILQAAETCLRERGLNRLNIRDIAREAGVSLGSVHYYFFSKERILMEIFQEFVRHVSEATLLRGADRNPTQTVMDFLDSFFDELVRDPSRCQVFIDLWDHLSSHEALKKLLVKFYNTSLQWLTELIQEGNGQGVFHVEDPALAAGQLVALIDGIKVQLRLFGSEGVDLEKTRNACKGFVLKALA